MAARFVRDEFAAAGEGERDEKLIGEIFAHDGAGGLMPAERVDRVLRDLLGGDALFAKASDDFRDVLVALLDQNGIAGPGRIGELDKHVTARVEYSYEAFNAIYEAQNVVATLSFDF